MEDFFDNDIQELIDGRDAVVKIIYTKYANKVFNIGIRFLKDKDLASEIVQETFIKLWLNRAKLDPTGNLYLYIFVIAKRLCLNKLREINRSQTFFEKLVVRMERMHNETEDDIIERDLVNYTEKIIGSLPQQQQKVYRLSREQGLSHKEIAIELQISPSTVNNHLTDALKTLRTDLKYVDLLYIFLFFLN